MRIATCKLLLLVALQHSQCRLRHPAEESNVPVEPEALADSKATNRLAPQAQSLFH